MGLISPAPINMSISPGFAIRANSAARLALSEIRRALVSSECECECRFAWSSPSPVSERGMMNDE